MKYSLEQRIVFSICFLLIGMVIFLWGGLLLSGDEIVAKLLAGEGIFASAHGRISRLLLTVAPDQHAAFLRSEIVKYGSRLSTIFVCCAVIVLVAMLRNKHLIRDFFASKSHPVNLSILRIVFFVTLFPRVGLDTVVNMSQLPDHMRVPPPGLRWLVENLIQSEATLTNLYWLFGLACLAGLLGVFTRTACVVATALAFYLIGVPQFFGKINHMHHIIWVGALLAVSPCADVWSVDAWRARRRGITAPEPSASYGIPLRFVWLFLGTLYFFPGIWKYIIAGPQWFLSDNLRARMLLQLFIGNGWEPPIPMYQYSTLCKIGGFVTILWEVGFILLVFGKWGRYIAAAGGLLFHVFVQLFLNISFWPIHAYYVSFFEWDKLLRRIAPGILSDQTDPNDDRPSEQQTYSVSKRQIPIFAMGILIISGNLFCGFTTIDSWPFGIYPTFARIISTEVHSIGFDVVDKDGEVTRQVDIFFDEAIRDVYEYERLANVIRNVTLDPKSSGKQITTLWDIWRKQNADVPAAEVRFYVVQSTTDPARADENPLGRQLMAILPVRSPR